MSGLTLTAANYEDAVSVLQRRFGYKQQVVSRHMDILLTIKPVVSTHKLKALRQLYDTVESQVHGPNALGVSLGSSTLLTRPGRSHPATESLAAREGGWGLACHIVEQIS